MHVRRRRFLHAAFLILHSRTLFIDPPPTKYIAAAAAGPTFHFRHCNDLLGYGSGPRRLATVEQNART